jgi:hypothetical protein
MSTRHSALLLQSYIATPGTVRKAATRGVSSHNEKAVLWHSQQIRISLPPILKVETGVRIY